jgi:PKHD-type hydroxylase
VILCIDGLLSPLDLAALRAEIEGAAFRDGRETAGWSARLVKNNQQMDSADPAYRKVAARIEQALRDNALFMLAAAPKVIKAPLISLSLAGMGYGDHVDDAVMGDPPVRTDLSYTLFLSEPETYEGGALVIDGPSGEVDCKLKAGSLVLYGSGSLHRVDPVTAGERLVAVGWVQSLVRDPIKRELLFDLQRARQIIFARTGRDEAFNLLSKTSSNLLRLWSEV